MTRCSDRRARHGLSAGLSVHRHVGTVAATVTTLVLVAVVGCLWLGSLVVMPARPASAVPEVGTDFTSVEPVGHPSISEMVAGYSDLMAQIAAHPSDMAIAGQAEDLLNQIPQNPAVSATSPATVPAYLEAFNADNISAYLTAMADNTAAAQLATFGTWLAQVTQAEAVEAENMSAYLTAAADNTAAAQLATFGTWLAQVTKAKAADAENWSAPIPMWRP